MAEETWLIRALNGVWRQRLPASPCPVPCNHLAVEDETSNRRPIRANRLPPQAVKDRERTCTSSAMDLGLPSWSDWVTQINPAVDRDTSIPVSVQRETALVRTSCGLM